MGCLVFLAATPLAAGGAAPAPAKPAARPATPPPAAIPADVRQGLDRMGAALRALNSFELKASVTSEEVLTSGQKLQNSAVITYAVRRPDRMFIDIAAPQKHRQIFYDGKQFTIFGPATGYFASVGAPATIGAMLKKANDDYGIEMPMADLFEWGTEAFPVARIKSAMNAGIDTIDGRTCSHYAFRQAAVDWQVWIDQAEPALPCKLVITNTEDVAQPTLTAVYSWATNATFGDDKFQFQPPSSARKIVLGQVGAAPARGGK